MKGNQENFPNLNEKTTKKSKDYSNHFYTNEDQFMERKTLKKNDKSLISKNLKIENNKRLSLLVNFNNENMNIQKKKTEVIKQSFLKKNNCGKKFKTTDFKKSNKINKPSIEKFNTIVKEVFSGIYSFLL